MPVLPRQRLVTARARLNLDSTPVAVATGTIERGRPETIYLQATNAYLDGGIARPGQANSVLWMTPEDALDIARELHAAVVQSLTSRPDL